MTFLLYHIQKRRIPGAPLQHTMSQIGVEVPGEDPEARACINGRSAEHCRESLGSPKTLAHYKLWLGIYAKHDTSAEVPGALVVYKSSLFAVKQYIGAQNALT
jgi:hypothetical protein